MALRDTIEAAVNTVVERDTPPAEQVETPAAATQAETPATTGATEAQQPGRTAGRPRDEKGRLLPGKADLEVKAQVIAPKPSTQPQAQAAPASARKPPSSWKKDHWESWGKLEPGLQDYLEQREGEFARGVSTYKQEFDRVKPLADAMEPLMPTLKQYNIDPAQWITNMGRAHHTLVFGAPQQKLQMFAQLAQSYGVPIQALYDQQAQQQFLMQQTIAPQPQAQQANPVEVFERMFAEKSASQELKEFESATSADGKPLYPHFETVRDDMALLLESGKAQNLKDAYAISLRLHDDIWEAEQKAKQAAAQKAQQEQQVRQVAKAKATATSPRTATPSETAGGQTQPKGIRSAVEQAVAAHSGGGRV